jgi:hypothetical protein
MAFVKTVAFHKLSLTVVVVLVKTFIQTKRQSKWMVLIPPLGGVRGGWALSLKPFSTPIFPNAYR